MKVSLVLTIRNEAQSLPALLNSILYQTHLPAEVIVVDAASTDQSVEIIENFAKKVDFPIKIFKKRLNRARARNLAITKARYKTIAVTDAGCILDKYWLEKITQPIFLEQAETVAGYYITLAATPLQQAISPYVAVMPQNFDPCSYLPSSRSLAFTKDAWKKAGKYPSHLNYCEDLVFAERLREKTDMQVQQNALVYWNMSATFQQFFNQIRHYSQGDIEAGYLPHLKKISIVFGRYFVFMILPMLFPFYLLWPIYKHRRYLTHPEHFLLFPALQIAADCAVMVGAVSGAILSFLPKQAKSALQ